MVKLMAMHVVPSLKDKRICVTENVCPHVAMTVIVVRVLGVDTVTGANVSLSWRLESHVAGLLLQNISDGVHLIMNVLQLDFLLADAPGRCYPTCTDETVCPEGTACSGGVCRPSGQTCGGFAGFQCTDNQLCLDVPNDGCDPA